MHVVIILNQPPHCHIVTQLTYSSLSVFRYSFKSHDNPGRSSRYHYPHFTDGELQLRELMWFTQGHEPNNYQRGDLNSGFGFQV